MKHIIFSAALAASASAATVDTGYLNPSATDGFLYEALVTLGEDDSWNSIATVGGWSYADLGVGKAPDRGWGHAATWFLVELEEPTTFSITMSWIESVGGVDKDGRPGFTIYAGETINHNTGGAHSFSNDGVNMSLNAGWDLNTPALAFAGNAVNLAGDSVSQSFSLAAGRYTIALGNAHDSADSPVDQNYNFTFATVPEPTSSVLVALGSLVMFGRRRR